MLKSSDCRNPDGKAAAEAGQSNFSWSRGSVLTEEVEWLVYDDRIMVSDVAESAILSFTNSVDQVRAASIRIFPTALGES
jgi:hypothetical protein